MKDFFDIWSVSRDDIPYALGETEILGDNVPKKYLDLTDEQMEAVADEMRNRLEYQMDAYWEALRESAEIILSK